MAAVEPDADPELSQPASPTQRTEELLDMFANFVRVAALLPSTRPRLNVAPVTVHFVLHVGWAHEFVPGAGGVGARRTATRTGTAGFGAVPASGDAMAALPETAVGEGEGEGEATGRECSVCLEGYEAGDALRTMPCSHGFHEGCIFGWLAVSHLCLLCRFALPAEVETDVEDDEDDEGEEADDDDDVTLESVSTRSDFYVDG